MSENTTPTPESAPVAQPAMPPADASVNTAPAANGKVEQIREALKEVYDPEIPINIVDLGLIYKIEEQDGNVNVEMTLTSPHCPVGDQLKARVSDVVMAQPGMKQANVNLVFDPMWTKEMLTFEGKLQASMLGIM